MSVWPPRLLGLLRIVAALLFMEHGLMKLLHFPVAQPGVPDPLPLLLVVAAVLEIGLGILLTMGLFTRAAAFVASGQMAVAYCTAHLPASFWPGVNGGSEAILYCFLFLYLAAARGASTSRDGARRPDRPRIVSPQISVYLSEYMRMVAPCGGATGRRTANRWPTQGETP